MALVAELAVFITCLMQIIKSHPKVPGSIVPYLSGVVGVVSCLLWFLVNGTFFLGDNIINWVSVYQGIAIGVVAAVTSMMGYNLQKVLPVPNLLPTTGELDEQRKKEELADNATVIVETTTTDEGVSTESTVVAATDDETTVISAVESTTEETTDDQEIVG